MMFSLKRWRHQYLATLSDWFAAAAGFLTLTGATYFWFAPGGAGTVCTSIANSSLGQYTSSCQTLSFVSSTGGSSMVLTPLLVFIAVGFAWLLIRFRHQRLVLGGFGIAVLLFCVLSFGLGWQFLPAAGASSVGAALVPAYHAPE